MAYAIAWDVDSERLYETGVDRVVLYPSGDDVDHQYLPGIPWNGVTAINQSSSGGEATPLYADNFKYLNLISLENVGFTIEAYAYPKEFGLCDGTYSLIPGLNLFQQTRKSFGLAFRTLIGDALHPSPEDYKIHIVYNCLASPSDRSYQSMTDSPEAVSYSWTVDTTTINYENLKPFSQITIDTKRTPKSNIQKLERILYGDSENDARIPSVAEVVSIVTSSDLVVEPGTSDLQTNIVIDGNSVTGTLLSSDWLFDHLDLTYGTITSQSHYITLDFSGNDFTTISSCLAGFSTHALSYDIKNDSDHILTFEVNSANTVLYIVQGSYIQDLYLSGLILE